jgi:hypothetical protein
MAGIHRYGENGLEQYQSGPRKIISASIPVVCALFLARGMNLFLIKTDYSKSQQIMRMDKKTS